MKNKLFTLLFALLASTTLFALGRNDGSTQANAIEFDWDNGLVHYTGTKWYHLDLEPLYYGVDSLRFIITNPSNIEAVDITCQTSIGGETNTVSQTIDTESSFTVWEFDPKILVQLKLREIFFIVSSTGNVQLYWQRIVPSGDSCEEAKYPNCQDAETKWYAISAPDIDDRANVDSLVIDFNNWEGDGANIISVSFKIDCNAPAFNSQTFTVPLYDTKTVAFSAELLASLGWPELLFSCTSSTNCCISYSYYMTIPGESCEAPKDLAWNTVNHEAGTDQWYRLHTYGQIPDNFDLRFHFTNTSTEVNSIAADILFDCLDPVLVSKNYQLASDEDCYIDIDRDFLDRLGWPSILLHYASNQDSRIWEELIPELPRETFYDTIVSYVDYGEIYLDTIVYQERVILHETTWNDTIEFQNGVYLMDSVVTFLIHLNEQGGETPCTIASGTCGENVTWVLTCNSVLTISGTGAMTDYQYTSDPSIPWYKYRNSIKSIIIEEGVTSIGAVAFYGCALIYVEIPNSVTSIGYNAFIECSNLTSVTIPNSVTSIGNEAFAYCYSLSSVTLPNSVTSIGNGPFYQCRSLTSPIYNEHVFAYLPTSYSGVYTIPEGIESIAGIAFVYCNRLTHVEIPNSVTYIGNGAFNNCAGLTSPIYNEHLFARLPKSYTGAYSIPDGIESIVGSAFSVCSSLTSVTIPNSVTSIGNSAFSSCSSLTSVTIPNSVTSIGREAFVFCRGLISVTIGNGVTSIGDYAFRDCSSLTSITCEAVNPPTLGLSVFNNVDKSIPLYVPIGSGEAYAAADQWSDFTNIQEIEGLGPQYVTIADTYNMAQDSAFTLGAFDVIYVNGAYCYIKDATGYGMIYQNNYGLQAGDHVDAGMEGKINIYYGCYELTPLTTVADLTVTASEIPAPMEATEVPSANNVNQYVVYKNVSFATDTAFTEVRRNTIYGSWNGQQIRFYNQFRIGATLQADKLYNITAFNGISNTNIRVYPVAVEEVSGGTPTPCITDSGTCGENLTWTLSCYGVLTISGTGDMTNYSEGNSHSPWYIHRNTIKSLIIEDGITSIGNYSFNDCNKIDSVSIPSSVTIIGMYAFMGCKAINTITIPNGVAQIQNGAFHACNGLTSVTIPSSVVNVSHPFSMCHNLSTINVANDNPKYCSIDGVLFSKDHKKLVQYPIGRSAESYIIPDSVQQIVIAAFAACSNLSSITIPQEVTNIGIRAFYNCTNLTSVVCQAINPPTLGDNVFELVDLPSCTLHVPAESVAAYQAADGWKEFGSILPIGETQDYITIAQAIEIGMALDSMATSTEIYTVEGYVINAGSFSTSQKYQSWYMSDDVYATSSSFQAYKCYPTDGVDTFAITNGYRVRMTGHLQKYYTLSTSTYTVEMKLVPATIIAEQQVADTLTVAEALAIGAELPAGGFTPVKYVIRGYVSHIDTPFEESTGFETFYIADDISTPAYSNQTGGFHIYRGSPVTGEAIAQGALVEITTAIYNYRGTIIENYGQLIPVTVIQEAPECNTLTGICGENLTWTLSTCEGLLTISGTGATYNYSKENVAPWVYYDVISAVVENGVTALGAFAFYGCSMISISIPESVSNIAFNTFNNCNNLLNFMVDPGNLAYSSVDGVLFNQDQTIIVRYPRGRQGEYTIPDGVVIVGDGAFNGCYRVTNVTIPNSVTTLGCAAFFSCGMSSITIPANVNRIDSLVFIGCQHLNVVTNYAIVPQVIDTNVFGGVIDISECTLYVPAQSLAAYQAADVWKDFGTILPIGDEPETPCTTLSGTCGENLTWELTCDSVLTISGSGAMTNYASRLDVPWYEHRAAVRTLQIGDEVTTISDNAFYGCSELTSITLGDNITSVGQRGFRDCSNVRTVTIGKNVVALGNSIFHNCDKIESVQWNAINFRQQKPNQDENSFPFYSARNTITSFTFGEEVEYIPAYLMKDYTAIHHITIPASVTEIGDYAFANDSFVTYMHSPIQAITCYAVTPPTVYAATFMGIDKSACTLYVPYASIGLYRNAYEWSEFFTILPIDEPVEPDPTYINVNYLDQAGNLFAAEYVALHLPEAPIIEGFSFLKWQVVAGDLEDGIVIQAVYSANEPSSAPEVYTNPANHAQKLIRNGHVYILKDDKVYTIHGQKVK